MMITDMTDDLIEMIFLQLDLYNFLMLRSSNHRMHTISSKIPINITYMRPYTLYNLSKQLNIVNAATYYMSNTLEVSKKLIERIPKLQLYLSDDKLPKETLGKIADCYHIASTSSTNIVDDDLKPFYTSKCKKLEIYGCFNLTDDCFKYLKNLTTLKVTMSYLKKPIPIKNIAMGSTMIDDDDLEILSKSKTVEIPLCRNISDRGIYHLRNVRNVDLSFNDITDDALEYLSNARSVKVRETKISNAGLHWLSKCEQVDVSRCMITDVRCLMNCLELNIGYTNVDDNGLDIFWGEWIDISMTNITDGGVHKLYNAKTIIMQYMKLTERGISILDQTRTIDITGIDLSLGYITWLRSRHNIINR